MAYTRQRLTEKDKKELRYQCRAGIVMLFIVPVPLTFMIVPAYSLAFREPNAIDYMAISALAILLTLIIAYTMTYKYIKDIRHDEKELHLKIIDRMEKKIDFEAGSGKVGCVAREMKSFTQYSFIIDNIRYKVEEELFQQCEEGDEVFFAIAPISKYRLAITKR